ncbi:transcription factor LHW isoform X2 [Cynara cardunculus var. scolymus]|uniref:transcription factor LHW isoform X2 n=1 Tax=Cynara cardunculus var. scolymus TaxID=59895 RepID=UPI000D62ADDA|nr:transcription factor LHW isoform X2 [Cynara cardunculus var. scolymus]
MGYLLKEALKTLCGVNQWSYAIFWKIGCQNPKLLIWEECYYEPVIYANAGNGVQARNKVHTLVTKMMKDSYINLLGEGLVGRVAFTRNHQWIISDNKMLGVHPPEVSNEVYTQFSADIHTIAVIPVHPHGVVQLGSSSTIMENMGFVNDVKSLISQLGCVPGALLSENYMQNEGSLDPSPNHREPICLRDSVSTHSSGKSKLTYCTLFTSDGCNQQGHSPQASGTSGHTSFSLSRHIGHSQVASGSMLASPPIIFQSSTKSCEVQEIGASGEVVPQANLYPKNDQQTSFGSFLANCDTLRSMEQHILSDAFLGDLENDTMMSQIARKSNDVRGLAASSNPPPLSDAHFTCTHVDEPKPTFDKEKLEHELFQALTMSSEEACPKAPSRDDLFDIVGMDFRNKLFGGNHNNFVNNGVEPNPQNLTRNDSSVLELQSAAGSDLFSVYEGESDSGIYSSTASDHLLDAVVSKVHTSLAKNNGSSVPVAYSSPIWANQGVHLMQGELVGVPKSLKKTGVTSSYSYKSGISKEDVGNFSDSSSIISSQISSWKEQRHNVRKNSSGVASEYAKRADEISKSNRKRLKPGENPRPRPKDRQMIQDRVKELREIIPNGAKCSIDALLERTIKHMLFLQSVTKHADKLKQTGESKIVSKDGGLLLRDNFEGGATWAYEVDSQSMVCPIIVEDLNSPRQMLVEMLCEERGSFLEIADVIKGLGLTILKGVMESRNDKIWAHFTVEANRDVTRMEIFISLVSLLDCGGNANVSVHEQAATGPTGSA